MRKRLFTIIACLCLMVMTLTGCNLFQLDYDSYYNEPVVKVDGVEVPKEDLMRVLSNNYATFVQYYGLTSEEAFERCLDSVVNKVVLLNEAKKYEQEGKISFNQYEKNQIWRDTFEQLNDNLASFETEIKEELEITTPPAPEEVEKNDARIKPAGYESTVKVEYNSETGEYEIIDLEEEEEQPVETEELTAEDFEVTSEESDNIKKEAMKRYIKLLKKNEEGRNLSKEDDAVWAREVERIYENLQETAYIEKLLEYHEVEYKPSVEDVLNEYERRVKKAYDKYEEDSSLFVSDLSSNGQAKDTSSLIYYVPADQEQYFYVSHILMGYSSEQLAEMNSLKVKLLENTISQSVYDSEIARIKSELKVVEYDENGIAKVGTKTKEEVLQELNLAMAGKTEEEKADVFSEFMYRYTTDDKSLTSVYPYYVGEETSTMMEDFTVKSRDLFETGEAFSYTDEIGNLAYAERWSAENVIDYGGYHIVMYLGNISNLFEIPADIDTFNLENKDIWKLYTTRVNPLSNKTYFDEVYEDLMGIRTFTVFENVYVESLVAKANIVRYPDAWKDLI